MAVEYKITDKGKKADIKPTPAGKVLEFMQGGHAVVSEHELRYELQTINPAEILTELEKGGYIQKKGEGFSLI